MRDVGVRPNDVTHMPKQNAMRNRTTTEQQQNAAGDIDPMLSQLATVWPRVPEAVKAGIIAMIKAAVTNAQGV